MTVREIVRALIYKFIDISILAHEHHQAEFFRSMTDIARLDPVLNTRLFELRRETFCRFLRYFERYRCETGEDVDFMRLCRYYVIVIAGIANAIKNGASREMMHEVADLSLVILNAEQQPSVP